MFKIKLIIRRYDCQICRYAFHIFFLTFGHSFNNISPTTMNFEMKRVGLENRLRDLFYDV